MRSPDADRGRQVRGCRDDRDLRCGPHRRAIADVSLTAARVRDVEVVRASFWKVRVRGAWIGEVSIDGQIAGLRINGVDVGPLIEAERDLDVLRSRLEPRDS